MPGFLLHEGAIVQCLHGGHARPTSFIPRVLVSNRPIVTQPAPYAISGCTLNALSPPVPCLTAQWTSAAIRITSNNMPVLLYDSQSICTPNNTPLVIRTIQDRVTGE